MHYQNNMAVAQDLYTESVEPAAAECRRATRESEEVEERGRATLAEANEAAHKADDVAKSLKEALAQMETAESF